MAGLIHFGSLSVQPLNLEREVNFVVCDGDRYLFRLVPGEAGFELSKLDLALDADIDNRLVSVISDWITRHFA